MNVGGQAVMEGVMMRGPSSMVIAVRRADGSILVKDSNWVPFTQRWKFFRLPLIRGVGVMLEALVNGMQALSFSAETAAADIEPEEGEEAPSEPLTRGAIAASLAMSMLLAIGLFVMLPQFVAAGIMNLAQGQPLLTAADPSRPLFHLLVGGVKMFNFIAYILLIRRVSDIARVFQYHGAEHKSIYTFEAGEPLTVENARAKSPLHPRCGTSFLVFVIMISIFVFAGVLPLLPIAEVGGALGNFAQAAVKIPLMMPIAGISYEFIRWAGKHQGHPVLRVLSWPGLMMQNLTTAEPDDEQLAVALTSLKRVLEREGRLDEPEYPNCNFVEEAA